MQMRIKLRKIRLRKAATGCCTLTCSKCGSKNEYQLFEGRACKTCWRPRPVDFNIEISSPRVCTEELHQHTIETIEKCEKIRKRKGLTVTEFSKFFEISDSTYCNWRSGVMGAGGKRKMIERAERVLCEITEKCA